MNHQPVPKSLSSEEIAQLSPEDFDQYHELLEENTTEDKKFQVGLLNLLFPVFDKYDKSEHEFIDAATADKIVEEAIPFLSNPPLNMEMNENLRAYTEETIRDFIAKQNYHISGFNKT